MQVMCTDYENVMCTNYVHCTYWYGDEPLSACHLDGSDFLLVHRNLREKRTCERKVQDNVILGLCTSLLSTKLTLTE